MARAWAVRNLYTDHWSFLFFAKDSSFGNECTCTLCRISFSPHGTRHWANTCARAQSPPRRSTSALGRGSLLTCGDVEQNSDPQHPAPEHGPPHLTEYILLEAILGILADAAPGPPLPLLGPVSVPPIHPSFTASFLLSNIKSGASRLMEIHIPGSSPPHLAQYTLDVAFLLTHWLLINPQGPPQPSVPDPPGGESHRNTCSFMFVPFA